MKSYMEYFKEICKIPHGSFETDKMKEYLLTVSYTHLTLPTILLV